MRILIAIPLCIVLLTLTANVSNSETPAPVVPVPKLEAFYQEVNERPILTVMLTNVGREPFAVLNPFEAFYVHIEVLDSQGNSLMKRDNDKRVEVPDRQTRLTVLKPQRGIHRQIDLREGITTWAVVGHGTMAETLHHMPMISHAHYIISPDDVSKIHTIRVTLPNQQAMGALIFSFESAVRFLYRIDAEEENLFVGGLRQTIEIPLDEQVNRTVPQFAQWVKPDEQPSPQPRDNEPLRATPEPGTIPLLPPALPPTSLPVL